MKSQELSYYQPKSLKNLIAVIIILLAIIGLINQSIGSFLTFGFYYLFGSGAPVFFVFTITSALIFINQFDRKSKRLYFIIAAFFVLLLSLSALFYQIAYSTSDFTILGQSLSNLGHFWSFYRNPNIIYSKFEGGALGGLIYTLLFLLGGRTLSITLIVIFFVISIGFIFWPLIVSLFNHLRTTIKTIRHRNEVIRKARQVPLSQTVSPLRANNVGPQVDESERISYFTDQIEQNGVKRAIFGDESTLDSVTFNPVVIDISRATYSKQTEHVDIDDVLPKQDIPAFDINPIQPELPLEASQVEPKIDVKVEAKVANEPNRTLNQLIIQQEIDEVKEVDTPLFTLTPEHREEDKPQLALEKEVPIAPIVKPVIQAQPFEEKPVQTKKVIKTEEVKTPVKPPLFSDYVFPSTDLLKDVELRDEVEVNTYSAKKKLEIINRSFENFKLGAKALTFTIGPSVTRFDIKMDEDTSVSILPKYIDDLNIRLGGQPGNFSSVVSGRDTSGFEVPNEKKLPVTFKDCINALPKGEKYNFAIPFGKNIDGTVVWALLDEFPHLLVAGSTGSGKSVFVHTLILTLLMRNKPDEFKIMIIDPKRVEMNKYKDLPHLLCPIIKEPKEAKVALMKIVNEMNERYKIFEEHSTNKLSEYNEYARKRNLKILPRIVVIVDEYADLQESEKDISISILSLAQKSRAAGIHMVVATQRPSVQVITGQIKANLPTRVALRTASAIDSTTIIGTGGAEKLLGNGDMLVDCYQVSRSGLVRIQGAYVDNNEIRDITDFLRDHYQPDYASEFLDLTERGSGGFVAGSPSDYVDELYESVKEYVLLQDTISINRIQTNFNINFNRAKPIYDMLMAEGVIAPPDAANSSRGAKVMHPQAPSPDEIRIDNNDY